MSDKITEIARQVVRQDLRILFWQHEIVKPTNCRKLTEMQEQQRQQQKQQQQQQQ